MLTLRIFKITPMSGMDTTKDENTNGYFHINRLRYIEFQAPLKN